MTMLERTQELLLGPPSHVPWQQHRAQQRRQIALPATLRARPHTVGTWHSIRQSWTVSQSIWRSWRALLQDHQGKNRGT